MKVCLPKFYTIYVYHNSAKLKGNSLLVFRYSYYSEPNPWTFPGVISKNNEKWKNDQKSEKTTLKLGGKLIEKWKVGLGFRVERSKKNTPKIQDLQT